MITLTTKVAQVVKAMQRKGTVIFNDRLTDGRRSLKVWGWDEPDYIRCKSMLFEAGCDVVLVRKQIRTVNWIGRSVIRNVTRLHVKEV